MLSLAKTLLELFCESFDFDIDVDVVGHILAKAHDMALKNLDGGFVPFKGADIAIGDFLSTGTKDKVDALAYVRAVVARSMSRNDDDYTEKFPLPYSLVRLPVPRPGAYRAWSAPEYKVDSDAPMMLRLVEQITGVRFEQLAGWIEDGSIAPPEDRPTVTLPDTTFKALGAFLSRLPKTKAERIIEASRIIATYGLAVDGRVHNTFENVIVPRWLVGGKAAPVTRILNKTPPIDQWSEYGVDDDARDNEDMHRVFIQAKGNDKKWHAALSIDVVVVGGGSDMEDEEKTRRPSVENFIETGLEVDWFCAGLALQNYLYDVVDTGCKPRLKATIMQEQRSLAYTVTLATLDDKEILLNKATLPTVMFNDDEPDEVSYRLPRGTVVRARFMGYHVDRAPTSDELCRVGWLLSSREEVFIGRDNMVVVEFQIDQHGAGLTARVGAVTLSTPLCIDVKSLGFDLSCGILSLPLINKDNTYMYVTEQSQGQFFRAAQLSCRIAAGADEVCGDAALNTIIPGLRSLGYETAEDLHEFTSKLARVFRRYGFNNRFKGVLTKDGDVMIKKQQRKTYAGFVRTMQDHYGGDVDKHEELSYYWGSLRYGQSLGNFGNHVSEAGAASKTGELYVSVHSGARGFGTKSFGGFLEVAHAVGQRNVLNSDVMMRWFAELSEVCSVFAAMNRLMIYNSIADEMGCKQLNHSEIVEELLRSPIVESLRAAVASEVCVATEEENTKQEEVVNEEATVVKDEEDAVVNEEVVNEEVVNEEVVNEKVVNEEVVNEEEEEEKVKDKEEENKEQDETKDEFYVLARDLFTSFAHGTVHNTVACFIDDVNKRVMIVTTKGAIARLCKLSFSFVASSAADGMYGVGYYQPNSTWRPTTLTRVLDAYHNKGYVSIKELSKNYSCNFLPHGAGRSQASGETERSAVDFFDVERQSSIGVSSCTDGKGAYKVTTAETLLKGVHGSTHKPKGLVMGQKLVAIASFKEGCLANFSSRLERQMTAVLQDLNNACVLVRTGIARDDDNIEPLYIAAAVGARGDMLRAWSTVEYLAKHYSTVNWENKWLFNTKPLMFARLSLATYKNFADAEEDHVTARCQALRLNTATGWQCNKLVNAAAVLVGLVDAGVNFCSPNPRLKMSVWQREIVLPPLLTTTTNEAFDDGK
jgi:hypothetical protein